MREPAAARDPARLEPYPMLSPAEDPTAPYFQNPVVSKSLLFVVHC